MIQTVAMSVIEVALFSVVTLCTDVVGYLPVARTSKTLLF
jgi:hypothetical protein